MFSSAGEKIAQFTVATPGCIVYTDIVRRSICLHNYDVLDDFAFISAVSFKLIKKKLVLLYLSAVVVKDDSHTPLVAMPSRPPQPDLYSKFIKMYT